VLVLVGDGGAEIDAVGVGLLGRVDDFGAFQPLDQVADAAIDLAQAFLAIDIVAVLRAVAIARRLGNQLDHLGPFFPAQMA